MHLLFFRKPAADFPTIPPGALPTRTPAVLDAWLAAIQGDLETAGPLGAMISQADRLSVARDLAGGIPKQLPTARARPLSERLVTALRALFKGDELP